MAHDDRAQWARLDLEGVALLSDLAAGASLVRPVQFDRAPSGCFQAPAPAATPLVSGGISFSVAHGASCNCQVISFCPHVHGTHTETVGHLTREPLDAYRVVPQRLLLAALLSVEPELAADSVESSEPSPAANDRLVTWAAIERAWPAALSPKLSVRAAVIRTLPNTSDKFASVEAAPSVPFLSRQAAEGLVARGIAHLVLDLPSADRLQDGGKLTAHRIFFGLPAGSCSLEAAQRPACTLTELAFVDDTIADGCYLLSLQTPGIAGDAVPSRPLLYPLRLA